MNQRGPANWWCRSRFWSHLPPQDHGGVRAWRPGPSDRADGLPMPASGPDSRWADVQLTLNLEGLISGLVHLTLLVQFQPSAIPSTGHPARSLGDVIESPGSCPAAWTLGETTAVPQLAQSTHGSPGPETRALLPNRSLGPHRPDEPRRDTFTHSHWPLTATGLRPS